MAGGGRGWFRDPPATALCLRRVHAGLRLRGRVPGGPAVPPLLAHAARRVPPDVRGAEDAQGGEQRQVQPAGGPRRELPHGGPGRHMGRQCHVQFHTLLCMHIPYNYNYYILYMILYIYNYILHITNFLVYYYILYIYIYQYRYFLVNESAFFTHKELEKKSAFEVFQTLKKCPWHFLFATGCIIPPLVIWRRGVHKWGVGVESAKGILPRWGRLCAEGADPERGVHPGVPVERAVAPPVRAAVHGLRGTGGPNVHQDAGRAAEHDGACTGWRWLCFFMSLEYTFF